MPRGGARPGAGRPKRKAAPKPKTICFQAPPDLTAAIEGYRDRVAPGAPLGGILRAVVIRGLEELAPDLAPGKMGRDMHAEIDRWIPDYASHGYTLEQAQAIADRAAELQAADPKRDWTEHLGQAAEELDRAAKEQP